jgi:hypothetical protein
VNVKAREARLDGVGRALVAHARPVLALIAPAVVKLVGGPIDHFRRVPGAGFGAAPATDFEQVLEVGVVAEDERELDRAHRVVRQLDALDQVAVDELPAAHVEGQLRIVELAAEGLSGQRKVDLGNVLTRDFARQLAKAARRDLECGARQVAGVVVEEPRLGVILGANVPHRAQDREGGPVAQN